MGRGLQPRIHRLGLLREHREHRLVHLPQRRTVDERSQRVHAQRVFGEREQVLAVKRGEVPREAVSAEVARLEAAVRALLERGCPLPERADVPRITAWAVAAQRSHWGW